MTQQDITKSVSSLESVAQQFEHWRATRKKRGKTPSELWALVAPLMKQYGQNEIATALRVNHAQLKERTLPFLSNHQQKQTLFAECPLPISAPSASTGSCTLEFTCKNGSTVKITGLVPTQMQPLISLLLGN